MFRSLTSGLSRLFLIIHQPYLHLRIQTNYKTLTNEKKDMW